MCSTHFQFYSVAIIRKPIMVLTQEALLCKQSEDAIHAALMHALIMIGLINTPSYSKWSCTFTVAREHRNLIKY